MTGQLIQMTLSLAAIVLIIVGGGLVLRRMNSVNPSTPGPMRVISSLTLGLKEKLLLVQVGEQQILLSVSNAGINTVHVFDHQVVDADAAAAGEFKQRLQDMMGRGQAA